MTAVRDAAIAHVLLDVFPAHSPLAVYPAFTCAPIACEKSTQGCMLAVHQTAWGIITRALKKEQSLLLGQKIEST